MSSSGFGEHEDAARVDVRDRLDRARRPCGRGLRIGTVDDERQGRVVADAEALARSGRSPCGWSSPAGSLPWSAWPSRMREERNRQHDDDPGGRRTPSDDLAAARRRRPSAPRAPTPRRLGDVGAGPDPPGAACAAAPAGPGSCSSAGSRVSEASMVRLTAIGDADRHAVEEADAERDQAEHRDADGGAGEQHGPARGVDRQRDRVRRRSCRAAGCVDVG